MSKKTFLNFILFNLLIGSSLFSQLSVNQHFSVSNTTGPGIPDYLVLDLQITNENELLVATFMGGLGIYKEGSWTKLSTEEGMPIDYVLSSLKAPDGSLWIVTERGLVIYDGNELNLNHEVPLPNCLIASSTGDILVGSGSDGLYKYSADGNWAKYSQEDGLIDDGIICLFEDRDGKIWIGTSVGVSVFDGELFTNYSTENGMSSNKIYHIGQDNLGKIWLASFNHGADIWDGANFTHMPVLYVRDMFLDTDETFWIAGSRTIYNYKDGLLEEFIHNYDHPLGSFTYTGLKTLSDGTKYLGTYHNGLLIQEPNGEWRQMEPEIGLVTNNVKYIFEDVEDRLWFGGRRGVSNLKDGIWNSFKYRDPFQNENIQDIFQAKDGKIWVSSGEDLFEFDGLNYVERTDISDLFTDWANCIYQSNNGNFWFGGFNGVSLFDGTTLTNYTQEDGLHTNIIQKVFEDNEGNIWFAGDYGISSFDGSSFTSYHLGENGFSDGFINDCFVQSNGDIWVGTKAGLSHYSSDQWVTYTYSNSEIHNNRINGITEDSDGNIWLAGHNSLEKYNGDGKFSNFKIPDGIPVTDGLSSLFFDSEGFLWVGTINFGVFQLDISTFTLESQLRNKLDISPNPVSDQFSVKLPDLFDSEYELLILDMKGIVRKMKTGKYSHNQYLRVNTEDLVGGLYVIKLSSNGNEYVQKMIVAK